MNSESESKFLNDGIMNQDRIITNKLTFPRERDRKGGWDDLIILSLADDVWKFAKTERHVPILNACCTSGVWLQILSPDKLVKVMQFFATSALQLRSLRPRRAHKCSFAIQGTWGPPRTAFICTKSRPCRAAVQWGWVCVNAEWRTSKVTNWSLPPLLPRTGPKFALNLFTVCMCNFRDQKFSRTME